MRFLACVEALEANRRDDALSAGVTGCDEAGRWSGATSRRWRSMAWIASMRAECRWRRGRWRWRRFVAKDRRAGPGRRTQEGRWGVGDWTCRKEAIVVVGLFYMGSRTGGREVVSVGSVSRRMRAWPRPNKEGWAIPASMCGKDWRLAVERRTLGVVDCRPD